jgi:methionyl-tRNA synthetase
MKVILFTICEQIKNISILLNPIIPIATNKVLEIMNVKKEKISISQINNLECFNHDKELKELDILFKKIENDN